jgi:hypothetical protein
MIEVPQELAELRQWVCWRSVKRGEKFTKVPCKSNGDPGSTTNPSTWSRINNCRAAVGTRKIDGIGFVFTDSDPYSGIDLDHCFDDKKLKPWAQKIVDDMDSYTELSPSGKGLHIIVKARVGGGRRKDGIEIYDIGRYFTFTGKVFENNETINDPQDEVNNLWQTLGGDNGSVEYHDIKIDLSVDPPFDLFNALLENDRKFKQTWNHQRADLKDQSMSSYDMSLVALAARTGWSDEELAALMAGHRRKWGDIKKLERGDYIGRTIARARTGLSDGLDDKELSNDVALSNAMTEGTDEALTELSAILGTQVDGFIRRGMEPTLVYAIASGREFLWGEQDKLLSYAVSKKAWFGQTQSIIKLMKGPAWERIIKRIIDLATYQADQSTGRVGSIIEELSLYISDRMEGRKSGLADANLNKEDAEEMLRMRMPFTKGDKLLFSLFDFLDWRFTMGLSRNRDRIELHRILTEAGYKKKKWTRIGKFKVKSYYTGEKLEDDDDDDDENTTKSTSTLR